MTAPDMRCILDPADVMCADCASETFRLLKNENLRAFGEVHAKRLVLAACDAMENTHY